MASDWTQADPLDAAAITGALATRWLGREILTVPRLGSTQDRVRELALTGARPGLALLAEEQTAGRGRQGQAWISAPGAGVWMTVLLPRAASGIVTLGAAVAVRRALARSTGFRAALKWPNDLVVGEAKLCGILGEALGEHGVALGIGLNVHASPPAGAANKDLPATHLDRELGRMVERNALVAAMLNELEAVVEELGAGHSAQILADWREGCSHLGRRVEVTTGPTMETGTAIGVDENGALLLARSDGTLAAIWSGSLRVLPAIDRASPPASGGRP
jgi:BirA family biotin operon repressor/biotin-[acetyl-CoA-carboxylase] ligase